MVKYHKSWRDNVNVTDSNRPTTGRPPHFHTSTFLLENVTHDLFNVKDHYEGCRDENSL